MKSGDPKISICIWYSLGSGYSREIDFVNGFIEVYQDALQRENQRLKELYRLKTLKQQNVLMQSLKKLNGLKIIHRLWMNTKKKVQGISAKVITVINEVGDAAPVTPIGINLPNNEWVREDTGSKSVSLGNIVASYNYYKSKSPVVDEFGSSQEVIDRVHKYGGIAGDLHLLNMHEVIGHASGQINKGVGTTETTLKTYAGVLEEARADLVGLYYCMDQKLVDIGVSPSLEASKAQYDNYIMNGLMTQLNRIEKGKRTWKKLTCGIVNISMGIGKRFRW